MYNISKNISRKFMYYFLQSNFNFSLKIKKYINKLKNKILVLEDKQILINEIYF